MKLTKLTDILPLIEKGETNRQIAKAFKVSVPTVGRWVGLLKKAGVELPSRKRGRKPIAL